MGRAQEYNATLVRREDVTDGLAMFHVELDEPLELKEGLGAAFAPGQYVTVGLNRSTEDPDDTRPVSVLRPMTIASAPGQPGTLEFYVRYVDRPESRLPLTHLLWELSKGDRLFVRPAPTGRFTERDTVGELGDRKLVMVAGGTGLAPFMSVLRERVARDTAPSLSDCAVLHGVSSPAYLGYRAELNTLVEEQGLRYLPTISRPHESGTWEGALGRVEHLLSDERIEATEQALGVELRPESAVVLVCGLCGTIGGVVKALLARGFLPEHRRLKRTLGAEDQAGSLFFEQYDADPIFDLRDEAVSTALATRWSQRLG